MTTETLHASGSPRSASSKSREAEPRPAESEFEYSVSDHGNVSSSAPYGYHDDCVIALGLAAWSLKRGDRRPSIPAAPILFVDGVEWRSGDIEL